MLAGPETRRCSKCKKAKPMSEFYKNKGSSNGFHYYCKKCFLIDQRERDKKRRDSRPKIPLTDEQKKRRYETQKRWRLRNKIKFLAHQTVFIALRAGKLLRPKHCQTCGIECKPEAHHWKGYDPKHWLDVIWLCRSCHISHDALIKGSKTWPYDKIQIIDESVHN